MLQAVGVLTKCVKVTFGPSDRRSPKQLPKVNRVNIVTAFNKKFKVLRLLPIAAA